MMARTSFYYSGHETIVDEFKKLLDGRDLSPIVIKALKLYKASLTGKEEKKLVLPDWRLWKKYLRDVSDIELKVLEEACKQLKNIAVSERTWRDGYSKDET